jgi:polar amino acid transport system substrate-binding protein
MRNPLASAAVALLAALALLGAAGCGRRGGGGGDVWANAGIRQAKDRGKMVVLTEAKFHPFEYLDESGVIQGFDVDLVREMAKDARLDVEFRNKSFDVLEGELQRGVGDFLISGMTITGERAFNVSFTVPYFLTRTLPLLGRPRADGVSRVDDLDDPARRVVAKLGTTGETAARRRCPRATIDTLGDDTLCALEVAQGRADAFIYDEMQVRRYAANHPRSTRVLEESVTVEPYGIACRKGDVETVAWLNLELDLLRRDGRLDALYAKHFPGLSPPK